MRAFLVGLTVAAALVGGTAAAEPADPLLARQWWQRTDLREHIGRPYLETYLAEPAGIHARIVGDFDRTVTIADAHAVVATMKTYDPRVPERTFENFRDGEAGFVKALEGIEGQAIATKDVRDAVKPFVEAEATKGWEELAVSEAASMALLASGSGTLVRLDDASYFYNVGYQDPIQISGRSYGVSAHSKLLDPSDPDFLTVLDAYLGPANADPSPFYTVMFELLTNTDPRGIAGLSGDGQTVITQFMTIYTAELDRNNMADLSPTQWAWQSDLAEVVLLTAYGGASGMAMKQGQLIACSALAYDTIHGIGLRADIMRLAGLITQYEMANHPELIFKIIALTPLTDLDVVTLVEGDVFRRALTFLNRRETMSAAAANTSDLTAAMVDLMRQVRADEVGITAFVKATLPKADAEISCKRDPA